MMDLHYFQALLRDLLAQGLKLTISTAVMELAAYRGASNGSRG